jgi:DNA polymerase-3 subunit beta
MILVTERDALAAAMSRVAGIVPSGEKIIPILGNVLLRADGNALSIRASNLDMEAIETIPAAVGVAGEVTVSATKLGEIARGLSPGAQVSMKLGEDSRLAVTSGRSRFQLGTLPVNSFPGLWTDDFPGRFEIDCDVLLGLLDAVSGAQGKEATRVMLMGTRFEVVDGRLRLVGTNGVVLAVRNGPEVPAFDAATVPAKMVAEMVALLGASPTEGATFGISATKVMIACGETVITSKLIDRQLGYPTYEKVIPKDQPHSARVDVGELSRAIRRAQLASQYAKGRSVRLTFTPGVLSITSKNSEAEAADEIDALYDGPEVGMAFDPGPLLDLLSKVEGTVGIVTFEAHNQPTVWRGAEDTTGFAVIMPQVF